MAFLRNALIICIKIAVLGHKLGLVQEKNLRFRNFQRALETFLQILTYQLEGRLICFQDSFQYFWLLPKIIEDLFLIKISNTFNLSSMMWFDIKLNDFRELSHFFCKAIKTTWYYVEPLYPIFAARLQNFHRATTNLPTVSVIFCLSKIIGYTVLEHYLDGSFWKRCYKFLKKFI